MRERLRDFNAGLTGSGKHQPRVCPLPFHGCIGTLRLRTTLALHDSCPIRYHEGGLNVLITKGQTARLSFTSSDLSYLRKPSC